jgi:hypothetical protein
MLPQRVDMNNDIVEGEPTHSTAYSTDSSDSSDSTNIDEAGLVYISFTFNGHKRTQISSFGSKLLIKGRGNCFGIQVINYDQNKTAIGKESVLFVEGDLGAICFNCSNLDMIEGILTGEVSFTLENEKTQVPTKISGNTRLKIKKNNKNNKNE